MKILKYFVYAVIVSFLIAFSSLVFILLGKEKISERISIVLHYIYGYSLAVFVISVVILMFAFLWHSIIKSK